MIHPEAADAARGSEAFVKALGEATELARSGEVDKLLADVLWFSDDLLDIDAACVQRPNVGEGPRGPFMEMRVRVAAPRGQLAGSPHEPSRA
jgi:hypothetical protein